MGRFTSSLSTVLFGSQSQIILPNSSFVGECYLQLRLPNLWPGQTISRGWGYMALQQMSYLFGSSNVSQIPINGQTLWHVVSQSCETSEKRSEFWRLGGDEYLGPVTRLNPTTGLPERDPDFELVADILIPLPFSSSCGLFQKKSFDTNLLSNPFTIQIQFGQANSILGGSQSPNPFPSGFLSGTMLFRQGDLADKAMSLKNTLMARPEEMLFYPEIYTQSYVPTQFFGSNNPASPITVPLLGFINADLVAITIGVVRVDMLSPPAGGAPNAAQFDNIQNIDLKWNGIVMFSAPRSAWKLYTTKGSLGGQYYHGSLITPTAPGSPAFTSVPQDNYLLHIDFTAIGKALVYQGLMQNCWRIANNALTLSFNTEADATVRYQMFCSYHYNAVVAVQQGQTSLYLD